MFRKISVTASQKYGSAGLLKGLVSNAHWQCNVLTTLLWIGILTAPPRYRGFDLSTFWAWLRYASAISDKHVGLRLKSIWSEADAHQKTVMSDDFGMGFSCHYLVEQHGIQAFANTSYLLDALAGVITLRANRRGPAKSPDFIGIDASDHLHILECKGTQASISQLWSAIERGIPQKGNISNSTPFASCMVGGLFFPQYASKEEALLLYVDPEPDSRMEIIAEAGRSRVAAAIYRIFLAKELMAAGLWRTATALEARERPFYLWAENDIENDLNFAGFAQNSGSWRRQIDYRSIELEETTIGNEMLSTHKAWRTSLSLEVGEDVIDFFRMVRAMDAAGNHKDADEAIVERVRAKTNKRSVSTLSRGSDESPMETLTRQVESAWSEGGLNIGSSSLIGPSGIKFVLSRIEG